VPRKELRATLGRVLDLLTRHGGTDVSRRGAELGL